MRSGAHADRRDIEAGRAHGVRFLLQHFQSQGEGRFIGRARSRVLETALTLHVLKLADLDPAWQQRLRDHLLQHEASTNDFSRLLALAALGRARADDALEPLQRLMGPLAYAKRRKKALLLMLMVELGLSSLEHSGVIPEDFAERAVHRFSESYGAALRLIHARHAKSTSTPAAGDLALLESRQAPNGSWEQQSLITLVAMMALGPTHPAFARGLRFLRELEQEDGGIPFLRDVDVWLNAMIGLSLQAGALLPEARREVSRFLVRRQHPNGGWSFSDGVQQTDTDSTANCAQALLQEDAVLYAPVVHRALDYFQSLQREDGGYPTYEREAESEITLTANILLVQNRMLHRRPDLRPAMHRARQFLRERQRSDGRFETSWSQCETYSIFRVLWALECHEQAEPDLPSDLVRERALRYLLESQGEDGGWRQSATAPVLDGLSTAYALAALRLPRCAN
ncbi:prenyltransferase/squalene oxidase repeat-containing protein, partial [Myxococcus fulvus]|uniref:prenyltransferase/squalene oxidase repeat-containing protein n=1 Tax=Myxococcus fulvus TaxID=33 RepID=UPI003B9BE3C4